MAKLKDLSTLLPISGTEDDLLSTYAASPLTSRLSRLFTEEDNNFQVIPQDVAPVVLSESEAEGSNVKPIEPRPAMITQALPNLELDPGVREQALAAIREQDISRSPAVATPATQQAEIKKDDSEGYYNTLKSALSALGGAQSMASGVARKPDLSILDDLRDSPKRAAELEAKRTAIESEKINQTAKKLDLENTQKMNDPKSAESEAFRQQVLSLFPEYKNKPGFNLASAAQLENTFKFLNLKEQVESRKETAALKRIDQAIAKQNKFDEKVWEIDKKEEIQIAKEDRKLRRELDRAEAALTSQLDQLKTAKDRFKEYSNKSYTGTGPLATGLGMSKYVSQATEKLDSTFKKIALDDMVKMFAGMSKAVDSDAERRAFESTQPNIALDDATNEEILNDKIKAAQNLLAKTRAAKQRFDESGKFEQSSAESTDKQEQPKKTVVQKFHSKSTNKTKFIYNDGSEEIVDGIK